MKENKMRPKLNKIVIDKDDVDFYFDGDPNINSIRSFQYDSPTRVLLESIISLIDIYNDLCESEENNDK